MGSSVKDVNVFATAPSGASAPDSITKVGNDTFVEYGNGADSTGANGSSQVVEYGQYGRIIASYTLAGTVDGLKYNPQNGLVYALQNQDGNSTLTTISPRTGQTSQPFSYAQPSSSRGYDDIVFKGRQVFESYTNPVGNGDAVIARLEHGNGPSGSLQTVPILNSDATGLNTVTGQRNQPLPITDPDSLKVAPNGDLILTGASDGVIADIHNPGQANQQVRFTQVTDANGNAASGLDDVIKPSATSGTFQLTNTSGNEVLSFSDSRLNPNDYYASVAGLGGFGQIDPHTGVFTLLVPASGAHGLTFTSGPAAGANFFGQAASAFSAPASVADLAQALHDGPSGAGTSAPTLGQDAASVGDLAAPLAHQHAQATKFFG